jgi:predicted DNA-binding transcriptional regulator AlpA
VTKRPSIVANDERQTIDERDTYDLMRSIAAGALSGGLTFVRAKMGDAEFSRALSRVRLSEPIVRVVGAPQNDQQKQLSEAEPMPIAVMRPAAPAEPSKYLDEKQLCAELDISSVTATKWRRNAEGPPFIRVGRLIRYPREAVEAWLASRTVGIPRAPK